MAANLVLVPQKLVRSCRRSRCSYSVSTHYLLEDFHLTKTVEGYSIIILEHVFVRFDMTSLSQQKIVVHHKLVRNALHALAIHLAQFYHPRSKYHVPYYFRIEHLSPYVSLSSCVCVCGRADSSLTGHSHSWNCTAAPSE